MEKHPRNYHLNHHLQCFLQRFQFKIYRFLCSFFLDTTKKIIKFIFCLIVCFFYDIVSYIRIQCSLNILVFIFDTLYFKMLGMFSIPLFISFFPVTEFIALEPMLNPRFAKLSAIPFPDCTLRMFLIFFFLFFLLCLVLVHLPEQTLLFYLFFIFF